MGRLLGIVSFFPLSIYNLILPESPANGDTCLQLNIGIIATSALSLKPLVSKVLKLTDYTPASNSYHESQSHDTLAFYTIGESRFLAMPPRDQTQDASRDFGHSNKAKG